MFNNVLIPMSAFAHSDYMINSCLNRLVVSIRYWNACPRRCWFSENYTTSSNNMSNIAHMSGSIVLTGYRGTAHELMVASWGSCHLSCRHENDGAPAFASQLKGLIRWSVCKLQCQMAEDYFHFFPWILHVARIQPTLGGNRMTHTRFNKSLAFFLTSLSFVAYKVNWI